eukprot:1161086-Pelagomonas_calceolata.AAC.2
MESVRAALSCNSGNMVLMPTYLNTCWVWRGEPQLGNGLLGFCYKLQCLCLQNCLLANALICGRSDFHPHPLPRHEAAGPQYQPMHIPFEGVSSYKLGARIAGCTSCGGSWGWLCCIAGLHGDYVPHQLERRPPAGPNYVPSLLPFEGGYPK